MIRSPLTHAIVATLLVSALGSALASEVYRHVDKDGRVTYSDTPPAAGNGQATRIRIFKGPSADEPAHEPAQPAQRLREVDTRIERRVTEERATAERIAAARQKVAERREALEAGKVPLPGERQGLPFGKSRLRPAYFERVANLEARLADAEAELDALLN